MGKKSRKNNNKNTRNPKSQVPKKEVSKMSKELSPLEQQIQELQHKKNKIDYYKEISNDLDIFDPNIQDYKVEVIKDILEFISSAINSIENTEIDTPNKPEAESKIFTADEINTLKNLASRVLNKNKPNPKIHDVSKETEFSKPQIDPTEQLQFVKENKHLIEKRVTIQVKDGQMAGFVAGLEAPNVVIRLGDGEVVRVTRDKVIV